MRAFAQFMQRELGLAAAGEDVADICAGSDRYAMYRAGPVLSISVSPAPCSCCQGCCCALSVPGPTAGLCLPRPQGWGCHHLSFPFSLFSHCHQCKLPAMAKLLLFEQHSPAPGLSVCKVPH